MSTSIDIHPQQRVKNGGWKQCAEHQAQRFAVVSIKRLTIGSAPKAQVKVLASFRTKAEALAVRDSMHKGAKRRQKGSSAKRPEGLPQPGERMPPRPEGVNVIARSLTQEQYNALRNQQA